MKRLSTATPDRVARLSVSRRPAPRASGLAPHAAPLTEAEAAHVLRRTGFGAPRAQVTALVGQASDTVVDALVDNALALPVPERPDWADIPPPGRDATQQARMQFQQDNMAWGRAFRRSWVKRMRHDGLRERLALFWHNHFVTSIQDYRLASLAVRYVELLHTYALGNFRDFVYAIGLTPAMLIYLDGVSNRKGAPNENYARELCELFTMGVEDEAGEPNYTQEDIAELARALTGWIVEPATLETIFADDYILLPSRKRFDDGEKTIFGRTGPFGYDDAIALIFEERGTQTARHIVRALYAEFVYVEPDDAVVDELATLFIDGGWELAPVVRALLKSAHFLDPAFFGARIKSPIEHALAAIAEIEIPIEQGDPETAYQTVLRAAGLSGQELLAPPNVAGWPGHHDWLDTSRLPSRWQVSSGLSRYSDVVALAGLMSDPEDPYALAEDLARHLVPVDLPPETVAELTPLLLSGTPDYEWAPFTDGGQQRMRDFLAYLMQLPEYQLT